MLVTVFIENPAGLALKHHYDEQRGVLFGISAVSRPYPYPYGFVLNAPAADGDNRCTRIEWVEAVRPRWPLQVDVGQQYPVNVALSVDPGIGACPARAADVCGAPIAIDALSPLTQPVNAGVLRATYALDELPLLHRSPAHLVLFQLVDGEAREDLPAFEFTVRRDHGQKTCRVARAGTCAPGKHGVVAGTGIDRREACPF